MSIKFMNKVLWSFSTEKFVGKLLNNTVKGGLSSREAIAFAATPVFKVRGGLIMSWVLFVGVVLYGFVSHVLLLCIFASKKMGVLNLLRFFLYLFIRYLFIYLLLPPLSPLFNFFGCNLSLYFFLRHTHMN